MDASLFKRDFRWAPRLGYDEMVLSLFELNGLRVNASALSPRVRGGGAE